MTQLSLNLFILMDSDKIGMELSSTPDKDI